MYVMFYVLKRVFGTFWRIAGCSGQKPALRAFQVVVSHATDLRAPEDLGVQCEHESLHVHKKRLYVHTCVEQCFGLHCLPKLRHHET